MTTQPMKQKKRLLILWMKLYEITVVAERCFTKQSRGAINCNFSVALSTKYFILIQNPNFTICAQGHTENPKFAPLLCCTETAFCLKAETTVGS